MISSVRRIPMSWLLAAALVAAMAGGVWWLRRDAYQRGQLDAKKEPLVTAIKLGAVQVTADSAEHARLNILLASAKPKSRTAVEKYMTTRAKVLALPDSAGLGLRVVNGFEADTAILALMAERSILAQMVTIDSSQIKHLRLQLARTDSLLDIEEDVSSPRCGQKCGIAIGGVIVTVLAVIFN